MSADTTSRYGSTFHFTFTIYLRFWVHGIYKAYLKKNRCKTEKISIYVCSYIIMVSKSLFIGHQWPTQVALWSNFLIHRFRPVNFMALKHRKKKYKSVTSDQCVSFKFKIVHWSLETCITTKNTGYFH